MSKKAPYIISSALLLFIIIWGMTQSKPPSSGSQQKEKRILTVCFPGSSEKLEVYKQIIDDFQKENPDIKINYSLIPFRYYQTLLVKLAAGAPPDIMWMGQGFNEFSERDVFLDLTEKFNRDLNAADFLEFPFEWYKTNGKLYGLPFAVDCSLIIYNKDLFDKNKLPYPHNNWTYQEFLTALTRLSNSKTPGQEAFLGHLEPCLFGAELKTDDQVNVKYSRKELLDFFKSNLELKNKYRASLLNKKTGKSSPDKLFKDKKAAMYISYTFNLGALKEDFKNLKWDIVMNPKVRKRGQWASSRGFCIWKGTKEPKAAWQLCKKFVEFKNQKIIFDFSIPIHKKAALEAAKNYSGVPVHYPDLIKGLEFLYPYPRIPHINELVYNFSKTSRLVWEEKLSPEEAADILEQRFSFLAQRYGNKNIKPGSSIEERTEREERR